MPKISVIVPVYNAERYLRECLDSIISQSLSDIEILTVDDGSTDSSPEILREYAERDERIKLLSQKNSGYGRAMNLGLSSARGEYVAIVESDDYIDGNMFSELYEIARKHGADFVKSDFYEFTTPKIESEKYVMTPTSKRYYNKVLSAKEHPIIFRFILNTWTGIYKRDFLEKNNVRHNETAGASYQDNGFFFQTVALAQRAVFTDKAYYHYRQDNPHSSINSKDKVFCISDEYSFLYEFAKRHKKAFPRLIPIYHAVKFRNYFYSYRRIACAHKLIFLERFRKEFATAFDRCEIDASLFDRDELLTLQAIIDNFKDFYYRDTAEYLGKRIKELFSDISFIKGCLGEEQIKEPELISIDGLSSDTEKGAYIERLEKKAAELSKFLELLKQRDEYPEIYSLMKKRDTRRNKIARSIRENGFFTTLKLAIKKILNG